MFCFIEKKGIRYLCCTRFCWTKRTYYGRSNVFIWPMFNLSHDCESESLTGETLSSDHQLIVVQLNKYFIRWLSITCEFPGLCRYLPSSITYILSSIVLDIQALVGAFWIDLRPSKSYSTTRKDKHKGKSAQRKCRSEILIMHLRIHSLYCFDQVVVYDLIGSVSSSTAITTRGMM